MSYGSDFLSGYSTVLICSFFFYPLGTYSSSGSIKFAEAKGNFEYKLYSGSQSEIQN